MHERRYYMLDDFFHPGTPYSDMAWLNIGRREIQTKEQRRSIRNERQRGSCRIQKQHAMNLEITHYKCTTIPLVHAHGCQEKKRKGERFFT
jgi:hypothetical protein